jgi:hypothetical protein
MDRPWVAKLAPEIGRRMGGFARPLDVVVVQAQQTAGG